MITGIVLYSVHFHISTNPHHHHTQTRVLAILSTIRFRRLTLAKCCIICLIIVNKSTSLHSIRPVPSCSFFARLSLKTKLHFAIEACRMHPVEERLPLLLAKLLI